MHQVFFTVSVLGYLQCVEVQWMMRRLINNRDPACTSTCPMSCCTNMLSGVHKLSHIAAASLQSTCLLGFGWVLTSLLHELFHGHTWLL